MKTIFIIIQFCFVCSLCDAQVVNKFYPDSLIVLSQRDSANLEMIREFTKIKFKKIELLELKIFLYQKPVEIIDADGKVHEKYDTLKVIYPALLRKDSVDFSKIGKRKTLRKKDYNKLFNICYANYEISHDEILCYNPRHGILFYDEHGKFYGFMEICFECRHIHQTNKIPGFKEPDHTGYRKLYDLFASYFEYKQK